MNIEQANTFGLSWPEAFSFLALHEALNRGRVRCWENLYLPAQAKLDLLAGGPPAKKSANFVVDLIDDDPQNFCD